MKIAEVNTTNAVLGLQFAKLVSARDVKQKDDRKPVPKVQNFSPKKLRKFFLRGQVPRQKFISVHFKYHPSNRIPIWCRLFTSLWVLCLNFHETDQSAAVILSQKFSFAHVKQ